MNDEIRMTNDDVRRRRRLAKVYRDAAEKIASGEEDFSCHALDKAGPGETYLEVLSPFIDVFKPDGESPLCGWWEVGEIEPRIHALLLMAEMVERGDA